MVTVRVQVIALGPNACRMRPAPAAIVIAGLNTLWRRRVCDLDWMDAYWFECGDARTPAMADPDAGIGALGSPSVFQMAALFMRRPGLWVATVPSTA